MAKAYDYLKHEKKENKTGFNYTGIHNVDKMTGKMQSDKGAKKGKPETGVTITSTSTSVLLNKRCQERIAYAKANDLVDCVCLYCFAQEALTNNPMEEQRAGMERNLANNYNILTDDFLDWYEIPVINSTYHRLESHGDTENSIQGINYIGFCERALEGGSDTMFAIWTKNIDIYDTIFNTMGIEKPENLIFIYSSDTINRVSEYDKEKYWFIDKVFTVWTDGETCKTAGHKMNCCIDDKNSTKKRCKDCAICYTKNDVYYVNECLRV